MKIGSFFFILASLILPVQMVAADPPIGSRIDRSKGGMTGRDNPLNAKSVRLAVNRFARCTAHTDQFRARKILESRFSSPEQVELVKKFIRSTVWEQDKKSGCFGNWGDTVQIGYSPGPLVGGLAEFFVVDRHDHKDFEALAAMNEEQWTSPEFAPRNAAEVFGKCVMRSNPVLISNMVLSEPDSDEEGEVLKEIIPLLSPCISEGQEIKFDKTSLRAMLSFAAYQALEAADQGGVPSK